MPNDVRGYDDFLKHGGSKAASGYLKNWKDDGMVDVILHPNGGWAPRWPHSFSQIGKKRDKGGSEFDGVRMLRFNCLEEEVVLKKQRKRADDGRRLFPPVVCPLCKAIEHVREQVIAGQLDPTEPIFKFETDAEEVVLTAAGWCGLFQLDDVDLFYELGIEGADAQSDFLKSLRRKGIDRRETFKEVGFPKLEYLFRLIQVTSPEDGYVIATVPDSLGAKIKKGISDRVVQTKGKYNPARDPLAMRWNYDEKKNFSDKYDVVILTEEDLHTPDLEEVYAMDPPSMAEALQEGNIKTLRALMEEHALIEFPFQEIFGPAERAGVGKGSGDGTDFNVEELSQPKPARAPKPQSPPQERAKPKAPEPEPEEDDDGLCECSACEKPMPITELKCPGCGAEYDPITGKLTYDPREEAKKAPAPPPPQAQAAPAQQDGPPAARRPRAR